MANIKLYRNCEIREEKNFAVDDIERYLRDLTPVKEFQDAQYIKQGLDIEIKVKLDQTYLDREWTNMFNYCRIENGGGDDNCCYYFIRDKKWISKEAIKLVLHMDVINTYKDQVKLTNKTTVQREHKDRFEHFKDYTKVTYSWADNFNEWEWSVRIGEIVGIARFKYPDEFKGRDVTVTIRETREPHEIDAFEYDWDSESAELIVTAYKQGEQSPIPQSEIEITVVTVTVPVGNKLTRKVDMVSEGFDSVLWNKNEDEVLTQELETYDSNSQKIIKDMDTNTWYITYEANDAYNSSNPDAFLYDNAINTYFTSDSDDLNVITKKSTEIPVDDLKSLPSGFWDNGMFIGFPTGASGGAKLPNSFPEYDDEYLRTHPMKIAVDIVMPDDTIYSSFLIQSSYVSNTNHTRLKQQCIALFDMPGNLFKTVNLLYLKRDGWVDFIKNGNGIHRSAKILKSETGWRLRFRNVSKVRIFTTKSNVNTLLNKAEFCNFNQFKKNPNNPSYFEYTGQVSGLSKLESFNKTDRTDQKLVKIINVPYCPIDLNNTDLIYNAPKKQFTLNDVEKLYDPSFTNNIKLNIGDYQYSPLSNMVIDKPIYVNKEALRDDTYESKLYHSDFYQIKLVYDSFSYIFRNELLNTEGIQDYYTDEFINVDYCVSNSIASSFGFNFSSYFPLKTQFVDYNVMLVNRNLEMPIYNNYYLNYLRNGYNYDVKNKQTSQVASGIGIGLSAASLVAGIALSATGYGAALGAGAIVGGVAGLAGSLTSAVSSSVQADSALQQRLEQSKNQSASVQGADDIGLLKWYANSNLCKLVRYEVSTTTKERLADLFYYCGYKCDYQDVPDTGSRYWFNFVQCNPVFDEDSRTAKMSKDCLDELSTKYQEGITFLHGHYIPEDDETEYDFKQVKENWEVWLV